jgi:hypothetical protein
MRASANGDAGALVRLRAAVFDRPAWEESILFAVERLPRKNDGAAVVAHAIRLALPIDPMLAAEMIYRASPATCSIRSCLNLVRPTTFVTPFLPLREFSCSED